MNSRHGISLIEMVVVLSIVGILGLIAVPAVNRLRESARETACKNNLRQIGLASTQFFDTGQTFDYFPTAENKVGGWAMGLLPFMEGQTVTDSLEMGSPVANQQIARPPVLTCPNGNQTIVSHNEEFRAHYVYSTGGNFYDAPITLEASWLESPVLEQSQLKLGKGPHRGGYWQRNWDNKIEFFAGLSLSP